jgi:hypothetical protein
LDQVGHRKPSFTLDQAAGSTPDLLGDNPIQEPPCDTVPEGRAVEQSGQVMASI